MRFQIIIIIIIMMSDGEKMDTSPFGFWGVQGEIHDHYHDARWGEEGYIRLARGDDCGTDTRPLDGTGCVNGPGSDVGSCC